MKKEKIYKYQRFNVNNMIPGDPKGSPDEFFSSKMCFGGNDEQDFSLS